MGVRDEGAAPGRLERACAALADAIERHPLGGGDYSDDTVTARWLAEPPDGCDIGYIDPREVADGLLWHDLPRLQEACGERCFGRADDEIEKAAREVEEALREQRGGGL